MSIQHALLTSLLEKPSSGYDLARRFDRSIGHYWKATHQQIYRELGRMSEAGWVATIDTEEPNSRRKVYEVLDAGRQELVRWTSEPLTTPDARQAWLVKLRAEAVIGPVGLRDELDSLIDRHAEVLDGYRKIEKRDFSGTSMSRSQRLQHAALRLGIASEEAWLEWAETVKPLLLPAEG